MPARSHGRSRIDQTDPCLCEIGRDTSATALTTNQGIAEQIWQWRHEEPSAWTLRVASSPQSSGFLDIPTGQSKAGIVQICSVNLEQVGTEANAGICHDAGDPFEM